MLQPSEVVQPPTRLCEPVASTNGVRPLFAMKRHTWVSGADGISPEQLVPLPGLLACRTEAALNRMAELGVISERLHPEGGYNAGLKSYKGDNWQQAAFDNSRGHVLLDPEGATVFRGPQWWTETHAAELLSRPGEFPNYAVGRVNNVVKRGLEVDRSLLDPSTVHFCGSGTEAELFAVLRTADQSLRPLNIQAMLSVLDEKLPGFASVEALTSQAEIPSQPRLNGMDLETYIRRLAEEHYVMSTLMREVGTAPLPLSVAPYDTANQANFDHPHVLKAVHQNLNSISSNGPVSKGEAARKLGKFAVSGQHFTVNIEKDTAGKVGDEFLAELYNHTHGSVHVLLKAFTLSGNLGSPEDINQTLSRREELRSYLDTARVGITLPLYDERVINAVETGKSQALERAAKCSLTNEGQLVPAGAVHDPIGRQKQSGRIEYTVFDVEANLAKVANLEAALALYTLAVQRSLLRGNEDPRQVAKIKLQLSEQEPEKVEWYLGVLTDQQKFSELAAVVDKHGFTGSVQLDGKTQLAGDIVLDFLAFIEELARFQEMSTEDFAEEYKAITTLKQIVAATMQGQVAHNFSDYLDPSSPFYMNGNVAMVARNRFNELLAAGCEPDTAHRQIIFEIAEAYHEQNANLAGRPINIHI